MNIGQDFPQTLWRNKTYQAVYSLGPNCACADYLRRCGLRFAAGPFDWLLADRPTRGIEILLSEFGNFLKREDLVPLNAAQDPIRCYYQNTCTGYSFLHDFNRNESFDVQFPRVAEKYARRAERILRDLHSVKPILLVLYAETGGTLTDAELLRWATLLVERFGENVDLLCIQYDPLQKEDCCRRVLSPHVCTYTLGNLTAHPRVEGNLCWDAGRILPIFASIRLHKSWRAHLQRLYPAFVRICSWFIWNKTDRNAFVERKLGK